MLTAWIISCLQVPERTNRHCSTVEAIEAGEKTGMKSLTYHQEVEEQVRSIGQTYNCPIWGGEYRSRKFPIGQHCYWHSFRAGGMFASMRDGPYPSLPTEVNRIERKRLQVAVSRAILEANRNATVPVISGLDDFKALARRNRSGYAARMDELLLLAEERAVPISQPVSWTDTPPQGQETDPDWEFTQRCMIATECQDIHELMFLAEWAIEEQYICWENSNHSSWRVTGRGAKRLDLLRSASPDSDRAFVAMWIHQSTQAAYDEAIEPGLRDAGYLPVRIDGTESTGRIDDAIIAEIRRARLVIADFTCDLVEAKDKNEKVTAIPRGGVYFEAGFADGLDIPVVCTCREDHEEHLHFDTRQRFHIFWREDELKEFRKALTNRIVAAIGEGPHI